MSENFCIRLPYLRMETARLQNGADNPEIAGAFYFWPGLPDSYRNQPDNFWTAPEYPFAPEQAAIFFEELRRMDARDLESMRLLLSGTDAASQARFMDEMRAISSFSNGSLPESDEEKSSQASLKTRMAQEQAQKILIWLWLHEDRLAEISSLEASCEAASSLLRKSFQEPGEDSAVTEPGSAQACFLDVPWRVCIANAALFINESIPLFIEKIVYDDVKDYLDFTPAAEWDSRLGRGDGKLLMARASLWQVLGRHGDVSASLGNNAFLCGCYGRMRQWLAWNWSLA